MYWLSREAIDWKWNVPITLLYPSSRPFSSFKHLSYNATLIASVTNLLKLPFIIFPVSLLFNVFSNSLFLLSSLYSSFLSASSPPSLCQAITFDCPLAASARTTPGFGCLTPNQAQFPPLHPWIIQTRTIWTSEPRCSFWGCYGKDPLGGSLLNGPKGKSKPYKLCYIIHF